MSCLWVYLDGAHGKVNSRVKCGQVRIVLGGGGGEAVRGIVTLTSCSQDLERDFGGPDLPLLQSLLLVLMPDVMWLLGSLISTEWNSGTNLGY